jgi:uncharacterized metal-binding protein YceD (DUF177 family)
MLIRIDSLSPQGLEINEKLSLDKLNARMNEAKGNEIIFTKEPECVLKIDKRVSGAELTGSVKTAYRQPCALCAKEIDLPLTINIDLVLKQSNPESSDPLEDDVGIVTFNGEHLELEDILEEHLILSLSPYLRPEKDCNGNCLVCGENRKKNENTVQSGINLGDLLKNIKK